MPGARCSPISTTFATRPSLFARVENLINEQYEEVFSFATPGRAGYGGVRVRF